MSRRYCYAFSFLWYKRIFIGDEFETLPPKVRVALLAHEEGHLKSHHTEKRILCMLFAPWLMYKVAKRQELEADLHAARRGFSDGLYEFLDADKSESDFYPSDLQRKRNLMDNGFMRMSPVRVRPSPGTA